MLSVRRRWWAVARSARSAACRTCSGRSSRRPTHLDAVAVDPLAVDEVHEARLEEAHEPLELLGAAREVVDGEPPDADDVDVGLLAPVEDLLELVGAGAVPLGDGGTEIVLNVRVEGSGPMAPMWEAMGRPLLPQLAKGFADQLKDAIEKSAGVSPAEGAPAAGKRSLLGSIGAWLRKLWQALFGKSSG